LEKILHTTDVNKKACYCLYVACGITNVTLLKITYNSFSTVVPRPMKVHRWCYMYLYNCSFPPGG
jgi:hypothetical protein